MLEFGIVLALVTAFFKGFQTLYQKRCALDTDDYVTGWSNRFFGIFAILPILPFYGLPNLGPNYLMFLMASGLISAVASILIARAYRLSDVSLVSPMFALTPLLLMITSPIMLGEYPSSKGFLGVLLIVFGGYLLKADRTGLLKPFRKLFKERGIQIILVVVLIYSVGANVSKLGVQSSSPVFWALTAYVISASFQLPIMLKKSENWKSSVVSNWKNLGVLGALGGLAVVAQNMALDRTLVVYVIGLKRLSIPISVLAGSLVFEEEDLKQRLAGSVVMALGAILISLSM